MKNYILPLFGALLLALSSCGPKCDAPCRNGAACIGDNFCNCSERYEGVLCEREKEPTAMIIEEINVQNYPSGNWDIGSLADVYVQITTLDGLTVVWTSPNFCPNLSNTKDCVFESNAVLSSPP